ncbi:MAG: hypothetical protein FWC46_00715 [Actinomycetia bacterium]|nr:hypothetical protein [Actinomycetes bacterium]
MKKLLAAWTTLGRHLRPGALVRDGVLLVAIGALAAFALLYAGRLLFDRTVFAVELNYAAQQAGRHTGGLTLDTLPGYLVGHPRDPGPVDLTCDATAVWVFEPSSVDAVAHLMRGVMRQGAVSGDGVLVDQAAAARMGVRPGDRVTLTQMTLKQDGTESVLTLPVVGVIAPFHPVEDYGNGGLVVVPRSLLGEAPPAASTTTYFLDAVPPGSQAKWRDVLAAVHDDLAVGPVVGGVLTIGLALWCAGLARVASEVRSGLRTPLSLLVDLGARPRVGRAFVVGLVGALALVAGVAAALGARKLITVWTTFYLTSQQVLAVGLALALAAFLVAALVVATPEPRSS